jgi:hypothetical protein
MTTFTRRLLGTLLASLIGISALAACSSGDDAATARPTAYTMPSGQQCMPWISDPGEADGSGYRPCDYPIPTERPVQTPGMSNMDYLLLGGLFGYAMGHHSFFYSPSYYDHYIHPAYVRYPGRVNYGYGHTTINRYTTVNNYNDTTVKTANTKYAADEKKYSADPKYSTYKTANGKTYTDNKLPTKKFSRTNVPKATSGPLGDAPKAKTPKTPDTINTPPKINTGTGRITTRSHTSHSSGSHSSGGHH